MKLIFSEVGGKLCRVCGWDERGMHRLVIGWTRLRKRIRPCSVSADLLVPLHRCTALLKVHPADEGVHTIAPSDGQHDLLKVAFSVESLRWGEHVQLAAAIVLLGVAGADPDAADQEAGIDLLLEGEA